MQKRLGLVDDFRTFRIDPPGPEFLFESLVYHVPIGNLDVIQEIADETVDPLDLGFTLQSLFGGLSLLSTELLLDRLEFAGYGFDEPIATNDTEDGRQLNRRTEFKVLSTTYEQKKGEKPAKEKAVKAPKEKVEKTPKVKQEKIPKK